MIVIRGRYVSNSYYNVGVYINEPLKKEVLYMEYFLIAAILTQSIVSTLWLFFNRRFSAKNIDVFLLGGVYSWILLVIYFIIYGLTLILKRIKGGKIWKK
ncbi:MAG: hypothetical protein [Caudoviricetes sp.]|nr:MAG: hypothetical protein [Caudoviricetes sp.]